MTIKHTGSTSMELKQFKLTNSDEIICEVVKWTDEGDVIVQSAMRIVQGEDPMRGVRFYFFRPFMVFQEGLPQRINASHIIAEADPTEEMMEHYAGAINDEMNRKNERVSITEDNISDYKQKILDLFNQDDDTLASLTDKKLVH